MIKPWERPPATWTSIAWKAALGIALIVIALVLMWKGF